MKQGRNGEREETKAGREGGDRAVKVPGSPVRGARGGAGLRRE